MKLGINQLILLKRASNRHFIYFGDVAAVYGFPETSRSKYGGMRRQSQRAVIICEKLEIRGLLRRLDVADKPTPRWVITQKGRDCLMEYFDEAAR